MHRVLEPEIMDTPENVLAYARADFSEVNQKFVNDLIKKYSSHLKNVLDLGCGPADIAIRLASGLSEVKITAIDASKNMIKAATENVTKAKLNNRISLLVGYVPGLPLQSNSFDAIISNSLLHHLPNPMALWEEIIRLGKSGAAIFIMDLLRPGSPEAAKEIVEKYSPEEHPILKEDFYNSLLAAFSIDEVQDQLKNTGLVKLNTEIISDRHLLVSGVL